MMVADPPGFVMAAMNRAQRARLPPGMALAAAFSASAETVPAPSGLYGGLAST
jgi:hypothetical protein